MIRIESIALSKLASQVGESAKALRGHGVEIGGLVVGNSLNLAHELVITGFVPVEIAYSPSPIFHTSPAGIRAFEQAIAQMDGKVIGYFRSQIHNGFAIREEDRSLIARLFPARDCCFVGIVVNAERPSVVHVHRVRAGGVPALLESFTLDNVVSPNGRQAPPVAEEAGARSLSSVSSLAAVAPLPGAAEVQHQKANSAPVPFGNVPSIQPESTPNSSAALNVPMPSFAAIAAPPARNWSGVLWGAGGIAVAIALAFAYIAERRSLPAQNPRPERAAEPVAVDKGEAGLKLHATKLGDMFEIRWDPSSPAVLTSAEGALVVTGGPPVSLGQAQLRLGQYFYKPAGNSLAFSPDGNGPGFSLMIYRADGSVIRENGTFVQEPGSSISSSIPENTGTTLSRQPFRSPPADSQVSGTDTGNKPGSRQTDELRKKIPTLIEAKRWAEAEKRIADLEQALPGDRDAAAWREAMTILRSLDRTQQSALSKPPAHSTPAPAVETHNQPQRETPPAGHEETPKRESETSIATLREPVIVPMPVESPAPPPSLPNPASPGPSAPTAAPSPGPAPGLSLSPPAPAIVSAPAPPIVGAVRPTAQPQMLSLIRTITGRWTYSNQKARRPRITNGFQFAAEAVSVDINPDGSGSVYYQVKPGIWHVAETSVQFYFRITDWDGRVLVGKSDGDKEYSLTLEPEQGSLNLVWHSLNHSRKLRVSDGEAALTKSSTSATR